MWTCSDGLNVYDVIDVQVFYAFAGACVFVYEGLSVRYCYDRIFWPTFLILKETEVGL
jgi:prepilin signal peptidase PulO-like enzyme (type II secretory pathway)